MNVQRMFGKLLVVGALVVLGILSVGQAAQPARAFEDPNERSSPMMGIVRGQTARLNVVHPGGPITRACVATLVFYDSRGKALARSAQTLKPGTATFLDLSYAAIGDPGIRSEIRARVIGDPNICVGSLEIFDDDTGKTTLWFAGGSFFQ